MSMSKEKRLAIQTNFMNLTANIGDIDSVVSYLFSAGVITTFMEEDIKANRTKSEKTRALLTLLPKRGEAAFDKFYKALIDSEEHVAAQLIEEHVSDQSLIGNRLENTVANLQINRDATDAEQEDMGTPKSHEKTDQVNELVQKLDKLNLHVRRERVDARNESIASRADIFIAMSTCPGYVSWRNHEKGTWFIQAVVYAFKYWAHSCELVNLMTKVNYLVQIAKTAENKKQSPQWRSSLGKSLYFFPGLFQQETLPNVPQPRNQQHPNNPSASSSIVPN